jgi:membrane-associated phospholipid phosphatase
MIGYLAGASYMVVAGYIGHYLFWGLVYIVLSVWAYVFLEKREHIFSRRHLSTLILAISSLFLFFRLLQDAFFDKLQLSQLDVNFNIFIRSIASDNLILLSNFFSNLFDYKAVIVYSILIILYWSWRNKHLFVYFYLFSVGGGILIGSIFKNFVERIRPDDALLGLTDFSFPSGHSLVVVVILGTLAYYVHRSRMGAHVRAFLYGTFSIIVFAVASSRLILSVHWLTDVIAGLTLGVFWVSFSVLIFHVLGKQEERWLEEYYERFPRRRRLDK